VSNLSLTSVFVTFYLFSVGNINDEKVREKDEEKVEGKSKANDKPESYI
jgi:hypothetical protein